jgi:hypothetical protein
METLWMLLALGLCFVVVIAKVFFGRLLGAMQKHIANADQEKQQALNELKVAGGKKRVLEANKATLQKKKTRLEGRRSRLSQELQSLEDEVESRARRRDAVRGKLVRPTRVSGPGESESNGDEE